MSFNIGDSFCSWDDVVQQKKEYEDKVKVELWVCDSRTLDNAKKKCPNKAGKAELGQGQFGLIKWNFLWNMPQGGMYCSTFDSWVKRTTTESRWPLTEWDCAMF